MSLLHNPTVYAIKCFFNGIKWKVSKHERSLIETQPRQVVAKWWGELNHWGWPTELLPKDFDNHIAGGRRGQMMGLIEKRLGMKYLLRKHNSDMTDSEFEDFWNMNHDELALERWEQMVERKYAKKTESA